jgi:hypothetical protein
MARLKEEEPDMQHKDRFVTDMYFCVQYCQELIYVNDRFKLATSNWKTASENPRAT